MKYSKQPAVKELSEALFCNQFSRWVTEVSPHVEMKRVVSLHCASLWLSENNDIIQLIFLHSILSGPICFLCELIGNNLTSSKTKINRNKKFISFYWSCESACLCKIWSFVVDNNYLPKWIKHCCIQIYCSSKLHLLDAGKEVTLRKQISQYYIPLQSPSGLRGISSWIKME